MHKRCSGIRERLQNITDFGYAVCLGIRVNPGRLGKVNTVLGNIFGMCFVTWETNLVLEVKQRLTLWLESKVA